ncbi:MAG: cyclase family protein [Chloroflexi bacterium]|nr:cyclase family protein [Chloroflexota bacterium]
MLEIELLTQVARNGRVYDLEQPRVMGMPISANHPPYTMALMRRHGDEVRPDGVSSANELVTMGCHNGTHFDALGHVSKDGTCHGGLVAADIQRGAKGLTKLGIETVAPMVCRGVLLDIPAIRGVTCLDAAEEVTADDLEAACQRQGLRIESGDAVLIRTGWAQHWADKERFKGGGIGTPGIGAAGGRWLAERGIRIGGGESITFEQVVHWRAQLPVHAIFLVEHGIHIIEVMNLEELARDGVHTFLFVALPLKFVGATGSPVRPVAIA